MKKLVILILAALVIMPANAQFFDRLIKGATDAAEQATQQQVNKKVEEGVDKVFNPNQKNSEEPKEAQPQQAPGLTCPACGHEGNTGKFCGNCGQPQPAAAPAACPKCGYKPADGNMPKFCPECGTKIE